MDKLLPTYFLFILLLLNGCTSDEAPIGGIKPDGTAETIIIKPGPEGKDAIISSYFPEKIMEAGCL